MLESLLQFANTDSTENINARLAGLIPKGIVKGGLVVPVPNSLQVRITGDGVSPFILLAFASDGMVVRELSEEHILPVPDGITSVISLRAKYVASVGGSIAQFEVTPLGTFNTDPDPSSLVRLCTVSPPANATAVLSSDIDLSFRDSIEGFTRRIVREVVNTKEDLPSVSGFPAIAEINFMGNNFALGSYINVGTTSGIVSFPIVPALNFKIADPSLPGLARVNPSQKTIAAITQNPITGIVTAVTTTPHGFIAGQHVRVSGNSATQANQLWLLTSPPSSVTFSANPATSIFTSNLHGFATGLEVQVASTVALPTGLLSLTDYYVVVLSQNTFKLSYTLSDAMLGINTVTISDAGTGTLTCAPQSATAFFFAAPLTVAWSGVGGVVVDSTTSSTVVVKAAPGVIFNNLVTGSQITISNATDSTFNGLFIVVMAVDSQTLTYNQSGYPTSNSGNGTLTNQTGGSLPLNAVEIGESATATAIDFADTFNASLLASDVTATEIGSSISFVSNISGVIGNTYTLSKAEPGVLPANQIIILSGSTFTGGVDPTSSATTESLQAGDLYVVLYGESGTLEIWGYDGVIFRNLTSASTATLLSFHRQNQFLNEKHLTENEKAALEGSVGVPSATNKFVTQEDTSVLTIDIAEALTGADDVPPSVTNRYLTEARIRGQRGSVAVPSGKYYVEIPLTDGINLWQLIVGSNNTPTDSSYAIPFFNVVFTSTLYDPIGLTDRGGPTEYAQVDFTPIVIEKLYATHNADPTPPPFTTELNPSTMVSSKGVFPRSDALLLGLPTRLWAVLNQVPNNGSATVLYSQVVTERYRVPAADMYATPQRILPAQVQELINTVKELRFNAGISIANTTVSFPANLFVASNIQGFTFERFAGSKVTQITSAFTINFATGATTGNVDPVTLVPFTIAGGTVNKWTKYLLLLTPQGSIKVKHIASLMEKSTDVAYASTMNGVSNPSLPFSDGSYVFATVNVQSNGSDGTTNILTLTASNLYVEMGLAVSDILLALMLILEL
jgi:hypothetical protein